MYLVTIVLELSRSAVLQFSRFAHHCSRTLPFDLELPRSAVLQFSRFAHFLFSNSYVRPRTPTFGLELSRSAVSSNSHVRPRTPTFGSVLELPRSASNSHVRPRTLTFGCVLELSRSASNSHVRLCHNFLVLCTLFQNHYSFVTLTSYVCSCTATLTFTVRSERDIPKPEVTKPPAK